MWRSSSAWENCCPPSSVTRSASASAKGALECGPDSHRLWGVGRGRARRLVLDQHGVRGRPARGGRRRSAGPPAAGTRGAPGLAHPKPADELEDALVRAAVLGELVAIAARQVPQQVAVLERPLNAGAAGEPPAEPRQQALHPSRIHDKTTGITAGQLATVLTAYTPAMLTCVTQVALDAALALRDGKARQRRGNRSKPRATRRPPKWPAPSPRRCSLTPTPQGSTPCWRCEMADWILQKRP